MRLNAVLPRLLWNAFGAIALFGSAHGSIDVVSPPPALDVPATFAQASSHLSSDHRTARLAHLPLETRLSAAARSSS